MSVPPVILKTGDYVVVRQDTTEGRMDAITTLRNNGCRDWRFEPHDGTVTVHGFLAAGHAHTL